jgi:antitoxin HigA-1
MGRMHNPPHPGETLRDDVLPALGFTVTDAADALGVTRAALSRVLNGRAGISPEMALRLERWLGVEHGGRASLWLGMQAAYDLWQAQRSAKSIISKIKPVEHQALAGRSQGRSASALSIDPGSTR